MQQGWICIHRKIRECFIWNEEPYDKAHAWIDLLLRANHRNKKIMVNGHIKVITRGQLHTSISSLAEQWKWSRNKVYRFLDVLKTEQMITIESNKGGTSNGTTITIVNYSNYQDKGNTDGTSDGTSDDTTSETTNDTSDETSDGTQTTIYNNINNDNNDNNENNIYNNPPLSPLAKKKQEPSISDLISESELSEEVKVYLTEWIAYKKEQHRFTYKPIGFKKLLTEVKNQEQEIGTANVIRAMNLSMAKGYQGIIWDLVKNGKQSSGSAYMDAIKNRVNVVDSW